ncbi:MAG: M48 family metallopeptidase [Terricaulis sp.]
MDGRYADGRAAITTIVACQLGTDALTFAAPSGQQVWPYANLARADDGNRSIVLKHKRDTGERLSLDWDARTALRAAAPHLFRARAQGVESLRTLGLVVAAAWTLAIGFIVGVPLAAGPIADIVPARYRAQIALISWSQIDAIAQVCHDSDDGQKILDDLAQRLMAGSDVSQREEVWVSILSTPGLLYPNAFALPDNSIIVTDDLIAMAQHPDELAGVLAHEIAHIEHNHVMKNVIRSIGAGIFFDIVFGGAGAGQAIAIATVNLASLRFSREDEADADARGLEYLSTAKIDAAGFARLFHRLEALAKDMGGEEAPLLLSSHPASDARARAAEAQAGRGVAPSMSDRDWRIVRQACGGDPEPTPAD